MLTESLDLLFNTGRGLLQELFTKESSEVLPVYSLFSPARRKGIIEGMHSLGILFLMIVLLAAPVSGDGGDEFREVTPGRSPVLPEDLYYRGDFKIPGWYFTGHLFDTGGREFGYELTFFTVGIQKRAYRSAFGVNTLYLSHFAVSDISNQRYYFSERADAGAFDFAGAKDRELKVWTGKNALEGTPEGMHLTASDPDGERSIDLFLVPKKPFVLNGDKGYSRKSEESPLLASYYFSCTDLETEGLLRTGGQAFRVTGKSWFDREISSRGLGKGETGWDWFALQLDDGREIMLYLMRKKGGSIDAFSSGTVVNKDGSSRHLMRDEFAVTILEHYRSEKTGARYPSKWEIAILPEKLSLVVTPMLRDQEFLARHSTGNYYWEGAARVEGSAKGRAYVEMTGY